MTVAGSVLRRSVESRSWLALRVLGSSGVPAAGGENPGHELRGGSLLEPPTQKGGFAFSWRRAGEA